MPIQNGKNTEQKFKYNVAEYMFEKLSQNNIQLKVSPNTIRTVDVKDFSKDPHLFTKMKIIWARKSDKIKNEIDYDLSKLIQIKKTYEAEKERLDNGEISIENINSPQLFDKLNKFEKYSAIDLNRNRKLNS